MKDESAHDPVLLALLNSIARWRSQRCDLLLQSGRLADAHALAQEFLGWGDDHGQHPPPSDPDQPSLPRSVTGPWSFIAIPLG